MLKVVKKANLHKPSTYFRVMSPCENDKSTKLCQFCAFFDHPG